MFLSIIIPTYNCSRYIEECIVSIKEEMDSDVEIIIIDDGSTDDTENICKKYVNNNIVYYKNYNHGVSYSRNYGIERAQGEYIMFVDSDDILKKNWYRIIREVNYQEYDIVYFSSTYTKCNINQLEIIENILGYPSTSNLGNLSSPCSKLYRRIFLLENDIKFIEGIINGEDLLFNLKSKLLTQNIKFISHSIYKYRINHGSSTHIFNEFIFKSNSEFLKIMYQYFHELSNYSINNYYEFCVFNSIYIFIYRISLINDKKIQKSKYFIFKTGEYKEFLKRYIFKQKYGLVKNIFVYLIKYNCINMAINLMKIKNVFQNIKINKGLWEEI